MNGQALINVVQGDLTTQSVDAIVNAANRVMLGGGGVDGAIHKAAGRKLLLACRKVKPNAQGVRCPTGEARITPGFDLPANHVIHTVGPVYRSDPDPAGNLANAFRNCLQLAVDNQLQSIAFPALSCGADGICWTWSWFALAQHQPDRAIHIQYGVSYGIEPTLSDADSRSILASLFASIKRL